MLWNWLWKDQKWGNQEKQQNTETVFFGENLFWNSLSDIGICSNDIRDISIFLNQDRPCGTIFGIVSGIGVTIGKNKDLWWFIYACKNNYGFWSGYLMGYLMGYGIMMVTHPFRMGIGWVDLWFGLMTWWLMVLFGVQPTAGKSLV